MHIYTGLTSCFCVLTNPQNHNCCVAFIFPKRMLASLTCTVKFADSFERRCTSANAMVKPFSMLSLKLQKRMSMCLGTNCSTGEQGKFNILYYNRRSLQTEEKQKKLLVFYLYGCDIYDLVLSSWETLTGNDGQTFVERW